jgi:hypothetical protein
MRAGQKPEAGVPGRAARLGWGGQGGLELGKLFPLEILNGAFVLLSRRTRIKGTKISALAGLRIFLAGIETVLARL